MVRHLRELLGGDERPDLGLDDLLDRDLLGPTHGCCPAVDQDALQRFGAVLHHNFDKLALLGGASEVRYGVGRMTAPVWWL